MGDRVAAVVVTFNRLDKLRATLARLLDEPAAMLAHVVVVDNASTDGTGDWLAAQDDPRLTVLPLAANVGGAGGFEAGMRHARDTLDPDWVLVMDDDARPAPGCMARFHAEPRDGFDAWAAAVRYPAGGICEMNRPWVNPFWHRDAMGRTALSGRRGFHIADAAYEAEAPTPIDGGSFVGFFFSRHAIALAGLPDPRLFIYGDDVLYTLRLSELGGRVAFDPRLGFEHDCATFEGADRLFQPPWKAYYAYRNSLIFYRRAAGRAFWAVLPLVLGKWLWQARRAPAPRRHLALSARAVRDGLHVRLDVPHSRVMAWAEGRAITR
ncbi:glycosyltransferase [Palleronia sediminis]|nr:glycosyltransferase [Palleronia sediminis]